MSDKRFSERRKTGVIEFWKQERRRVKNGKETTREWSDSQRETILKGGRPKYNGKTIQGHHAYILPGKPISFQKKYNFREDKR